MMRLVVLAALLASPALAEAPADYAVRLPITAVPGAALQRLAVPAAALVAVQGPGLYDLRIFNGAGTPVPMALSDGVGRAGRRTMTLAALPILGRPGVLQVSGVTLAIDADRTARVSSVAGSVSGGETVVLGALFDTRAVSLPAAALQIDADLPAMQPVTFTVEASADLKNWQPVAEKTLYRAAARDVGNEAIALDGAALKDRYLRLRWSADSPLVTPVTVRGATLALTTAADRLPQPKISIVRPHAGGGRVLTFELPFAVAPVSLDIGLPGEADLLPVRIYGRNDREQPWTQIGAGTLFRIKARHNDPIALTGPVFRTIKVEADATTAGFAGTPAIALALAPVELVFLAQGAAPFTLAAGRKGATSSVLPLATLIPDYRAGSVEALPAATVADATTVPALVDATASGGLSTRTMALWAIILVGTATLAVMVKRLMRL